MEFGSYHRTNQTCLTQLSFRNYHTTKKTPPTPSRLPLPPTVSVLQKPSPVTAGTSGFGNHPPRAISYIARPNMPHRQTQLPNLFTRSLANNTSEEWPPLSSSRQQRQPVSLAPVILKVTDGKANFRLMDMVELKAIVQDITNQAGAPKHPETPRGGDLFIFPSDLTQQQAVLQLTSAANRSLSASLPKSSIGKKGIIHNVPHSESEEDLLDSLLLQGATKVERFHWSTDGSKVPTVTVCITFDSPLPPRVTIVALSFKVSTYYPSPYKCSKCWKIGHTKNHCNRSDTKSRKCGDSHDETIPCSQKCINCSSPDHLSDSKTCPAFLDLSALIKFSIDNDISIKDARSQIGKTYSAVPSRHPT